MAALPGDARAATGPDDGCDLLRGHLQEFMALALARRYLANQILFTEGQPATGLYLLCTGEVKLFHSDDLGREHILQVVAPYTILGELGTDRRHCLSISAQAVTHCQLHFLPEDTLRTFLCRNPHKALVLLDLLSQQLAHAKRKTRDLALKSGRARLAGILVDLVCAGGSATLPLRRTALAAMVGVSTETAIRILGDLRARRLVNISGRYIMVQNLTLLKEIAALDHLDRHAVGQDAAQPRRGRVPAAVAN